MEVTLLALLVLISPILTQIIIVADHNREDDQRVQQFSKTIITILIFVIIITKMIITMISIMIMIIARWQRPT